MFLFKEKGRFGRYVLLAGVIARRKPRPLPPRKPANAPPIRPSPMCASRST